MSHYVRLCPACQQVNAEYAHTCSRCGQFIGLESPVAAPTADPTTPLPAADPTPPPVAAAAASSPTVTQRYPACVLEAVDGQRHPVQSGWVVGQAHPSSAAQVQLQGAGTAFVHRSHCQLHYNGTTWEVTALDQQVLGGTFTNPTVVNRIPLAPGSQQALQHGDNLALSGVLLRVLIG